MHSCGLSVNATPKAFAIAAKTLCPSLSDKDLAMIKPTRSSLTDWIKFHAEEDTEKILDTEREHGYYYGLMADGSKRGKRDVFQVTVLALLIFLLLIILKIYLIVLI